MRSSISTWTFSVDGIWNFYAPTWESIRHLTVVHVKVDIPECFSAAEPGWINIAPKNTSVKIKFNAGGYRERIPTIILLNTYPHKSNTVGRQKARTNAKKPKKRYKHYDTPQKAKFRKA